MRRGAFSQIPSGQRVNLTVNRLKKDADAWPDALGRLPMKMIQVSFVASPIMPDRINLDTRRRLIYLIRFSNGKQFITGG